ncbi:MAG TPA: hypothetical protein V6C86_02835 [Oculatellaceae cyanobacterium]
MKSFLKNLYTLLAGPLYRRLLRDLTVQVQDAHSTTLEYQEKIAAKLLDELVCVRLELERAMNQLEESKQQLTRATNTQQRSAHYAKETAVAPSQISDTISDDEIHKIVNEISSHMKIVELACDTQVPMQEILDWRSRYSGLTVNAVRKMRRIERENALLKEELAQYKMREAITDDTGILS